MKSARRQRVLKSCRHCGKRFEPDRRAAKVQKYCSEKTCQQARQRRKYRRWLSQPAHAAAGRDALRAWAKNYPDYWRRYRANHPEYVCRDNRRRAMSLRRARRSAKQTDWRQIAVERLDAIEAGSEPVCSAKQTDLSRRVTSMLGYLRWTVEASKSAKKTGMAWVGGTGE